MTATMADAVHTLAVVAGTAVGVGMRLAMLRMDYRQYPSYPQGYAIHAALGVIAGFLGSVAAPAIATGDYAAATFLALAATQFREVRNIERQTLLNLEDSELVPRGGAYIEGIARVFEARNYVAMVTSLAVSAAAVAAGAVFSGLLAPALAAALSGVVVAAWIRKGGEGPHLGDLADVEIAPIEFDGPLLKVGDVVLMNIGLEEPRLRYLEEGLGVVITPKDEDARATLANIGQRQAIAHDASTLVGLTKEIDEPYFTPLVRRDGKTGKVVLAMMPAHRDEAALLEAVRGAPILEGAVRKPSLSKAGRMASKT